MTLKKPVHRPVMVHEIETVFTFKNKDSFLDLTFGLGGHTKHLLKSAAIQVTAVDRDPATASFAEDILKKHPESKLQFINQTFDVAAKTLVEKGVRFDGILLDLGMSSFQLDDPQRGFSYMTSSPLDLRMNPQIGRPAFEWLQQTSMEEIAEVLKTFGEEPKAKRIAHAIRERCDRSMDPLLTDELRNMIEAIYRRAYEGKSRTHPATKTFQAIRIYINSELTHLENVLPMLPQLLKPQGRVALIAFHSLEDRLVKTYLKRESTQCLCPPETPTCVCQHQALFDLIKPYPQKPGEQEISENPRARSAILRAAIRRDVLI